MSLAIACKPSSSPTDGGAPEACGVVPNKMLHEDYCAQGAMTLCLYDHPEGLGF